MRKILAATVLIFLTSVSSASACGYFKILGDAGTPVFYYAIVPINGSKFPAEQKMILYNFTIDNNQPPQPLLNIYPVDVDLTFVPTGDLINFVYGGSVHVDAYTKKNISLSVYIDGPDRQDIIYVEGLCSDGFPVMGTITVKIYGRGNGYPPACGSTDYSCGVYPNCVNVNIQDGCDSGYLRDYFCSNNMIKFNPQGSAYCCGLIGGTYQNGICNAGSGTTSTTTTTIQSTTTTTIQTGCTPSYALSITVCYDGYYRNYFCSGTNLKYTSSCTTICCSSYCDANGLCHGSSETTTTTTVPGSTTTTTLPSTCTQSLANSMTKCYSGYFRTYFCSGNNLRYTESCYNYCCNLIGGSCNNGACSGGSTSTTTTIPGPTTTTTLPSVCTPAIALQMTGCSGGYLRTYFCSGNNLKYTSSCISFCCSGNCVNGVCVA
jgi:hypothetical protein